MKKVIGELIKMKRSRKKIFLPKFKFLFDKDSEALSSTTILVKGNLLTCIVLSIASGFIDLAFFSGLSKSLLHMGTIPMSAAILYTMISIGFISAKFWCAMKLGMVKELETRLQAKGFAWAKNLKKAQIPWHIAHKFLIAISIITALSLSVNSIGAGIRTMEQNIKNMSADTEQLLTLSKSVREGVEDQRQAKKSNITGALTARDDAKQEVERYFGHLVKYQEEYFALSDEEKKGEAGQKIIQKIVQEIPGTTTKNAISFDKSKLQKAIQRTATSNETIDDASIYKEAVDYDKSEIETSLKALVDKEYRTPSGELIKFTNDDGSLVDVQLAISRLQQGIAKWQSDTGDVGESSKIFTLVATYINADAKAGGMGISEWMMMIFIALAGTVQEFLIALFTPKAAIDRKLLRQVSQYLEWSSIEEKEKFLIEVYIEYEGDGVINQVQFENKVQKSVKIMEQTVDGIINKYTCIKSDKEQKLLDKLDIAQEKINDAAIENKELKNQLIVLKNQLDTAHSEVEKVHEKQEKRRIVKQEEFSSQVDDAVKEIEGLI